MLQPEKAHSPNSVIWSDNVMELMLTQSMNAPRPKEVTLLGIVTLVMCSHDENAYGPIVVTPSRTVYAPSRLEATLTSVVFAALYMSPSIAEKCLLPSLMRRSSRASQNTKAEPSMALSEAGSNTWFRLLHLRKAFFSTVSKPSLKCTVCKLAHCSKAPCRNTFTEEGIVTSSIGLFRNAISPTSRSVAGRCTCPFLPIGTTSMLFFALSISKPSWEEYCLLAAEASKASSVVL